MNNLKPSDFANELLESASSFVPITHSLLDVDFYKFTMGQFIYQHHKGVEVTFKLIIRDKDMPIGKYVSEEALRDHLDYARSLRFTEDEVWFLESGQSSFTDEYLGFLRTFRLPPYRLTKSGDDIELTFSGPWEEVSMWETIALAIISELYYRSILQGLSETSLVVIYAKAQTRIHEKLSRLLSSNVRFTDFGQRRRHSFMWQEWVVRLCKEMMGPQFLGTSNVSLAHKYDIEAVGTNAHEIPMILTALKDSDSDARNAQYQMLKEWENMYRLSIMLPDTFTSSQFFAGAPKWLARWHGARQDSGNPTVFGENYIRWLKSHNVNPKEKIIIFSDGLDVDPMIALEEHFRGRINTGFGWGTLLTNDFRDCYLGNDETVRKLLRPFSMVCKVVEANGRPCVKLSDNPAKATGPADEVARYKKIFGVGNQTAIAVQV